MMRSVTSQAVMAVVALVLGAVAWTSSEREARVAEGQRALVTFAADATSHLDAIPPPSRLAQWLPWMASSATDVTQARAAARSWGDSAAEVGDDALVAANAAYRAAVQDGGAPAVVVSRLDAVVQRYADVMRSHPASIDAAWNYEFVVRQRAAVAARRQVVAPALEDGALSMHGRAGAPPKGSDTRSFRMIVPMRPDERRQADEAGRSGRRVRKG